MAYQIIVACDLAANPLPMVVAGGKQVIPEVVAVEQNDAGFGRTRSKRVLCLLEIWALAS